MKAKILIVGGGAMGTCTALHAAQRLDPLREPTVLLEKARLGAGSSGRSAAILHQSYGERKLAGMARDALKTYTTIRTATGRSLGHRRTGALVLAGPGGSERAVRLEAEVAMQSEIGIEVHAVRGEEIRGLIPGIEVEDDELGAWQPEAGFVDPARAIDVFAKLARSKGAVTRVGIEEPRVLVEDGSVVGVASSAGTFHAPNVVLATGPWTPSILGGLGVHLPLRVARSEECLLRTPIQEIVDEDDGEDREGGHPELETRVLLDPLDHMPVAHPVIIDLHNGFFARCEPVSCRTRVGRLEPEPVELDQPEAPQREVAPELVEWGREVVCRRLPYYRDQEVLGGQTSWATLTPDGLPVAGPVAELPGLWVVAGTTGNDFQLAPSIGEGIAQMILGQPVSTFDPEFLSPGRFVSSR